MYIQNLNGAHTKKRDVQKDSIQHKMNGESKMAGALTAIFDQKTKQNVRIFSIHLNEIR